MKAKTRREICELFNELAAPRAAEAEGLAEFERESRLVFNEPPNTPTGDYQFFLRANGLTDRVELWRAFLAGRLTA